MKNSVLIQSFFILLVVSVIFGCTDKLKRSEAEKMIRDKFQLPRDDIRALTVYDATLSNSLTYQSFLKLQKEGLLTFSECGAGLSRGYCATLTEKGKQYAVSAVYQTDNWYVNNINVKAAKLEFGEITGIVEYKQFNTSQVNYTLVIKEITPFGILAFGLTEGSMNKSISFTKFDNGWKISE
jgi:hypothetical protein